MFEKSVRLLAAESPLAVIARRLRNRCPVYYRGVAHRAPDSRRLADDGGTRFFMKVRNQLRFVLEGIEGVLILGCVLCTWPLTKRWFKNWGSQPNERDNVWPGDRFVSPKADSFTRAIDIFASSGAVWQWVVQFGLGRAGFYSYELLERIGGVPVTNLESVEPTMQSLAVGDEIRLHPKAPGIVVEDLIEERQICFVQYESGADATPAGSWSIYIVPTAAGSCRLTLRSCRQPLSEPSLLKRIGDAFEKPLDFVMEQRMLRTIKRLAESDVQ